MGLAANYFDYRAWFTDTVISFMKTILRAVQNAPDQEQPSLYMEVATNYPNIKMPSYLCDRYDETIILVLEHNFHSLSTSEEGFSVTLYFAGKPEPIFIPWYSIKRISDPKRDFDFPVATTVEMVGLRRRSSASKGSHPEEPTSSGAKKPSQAKILKFTPKPKGP